MSTDRLDEVFALFQNLLGEKPPLSASEPCRFNPSAGINASYYALTLSFHDAPFAVLALTTARVSERSAALVEQVARRARARKVKFIVLCNQRDTLLSHVPPPNQPDNLEILQQYPQTQAVLQGVETPLTELERIALRDLCSRLAGDLLSLQKDGHLNLVIPDAEFFVDRLTGAVDILKPEVSQALQTQIELDRDFAEELQAWATPQGIPADLRSAEFADAVTRQSIYRLLGKIIFYQSLRRANPSLPEMDLSDADTSQVLPILNRCFDAAHQIDYHAVFRQDVVDRLPFPAPASAELRALVGDLNTRDFAHLPQDVIGAVFERLIPPQDRHALGQFFTPEPLVDLITAFCVRHPEDLVIDPTCGTGTFLIRAYDFLRSRLGLHDHSRLLGQIWGADIAPFPAELATINLFRQDVSSNSNFPRVLCDDFFNLFPGKEVRFPPLKADTDPQAGQQALDIPVPIFDAIVGNFPYISASRIEERQKGYLDRIQRLLAQTWLAAYPDGFSFKRKTDQKQYDLARQQDLSLKPFVAKAEVNLSSSADLYAYLFWHAAAFLKPGGRMGIVTSNAWLDVGFGYGLQRFFLDHFKVIAVLESRCEPWFEQAAVNTVVTILERCESACERDAHTARFVKLKRPLAELVPWDMRLEALPRWLGVGELVQRAANAGQGSADPRQPETVEDEDLRARALNQGALRQQVVETEKTAKWGVYLRAPQVYFDLLENAKGKLSLLKDVAPPARGGTTRINEFFYVDQSIIDRWSIEEEFCIPLVKSPGESPYIQLSEDQLQLLAFVCRQGKDTLKKEKKTGALQYIEWGENQEYSSGVQQGMKWPKGPWVKKRKPGWHALPASETHPAQIFIASAYGDRFIFKYSLHPLIADKRLYFLSPIATLDHKLIAALMNSSITAMMIETIGRVSLGDGALELAVEDARDYLLVPDPRRFSEAHSKTILVAFEPLLQRPIGSIFEEVQQVDRQALDRAVLQALGLNPARWLEPIYAGLTELTGERMNLGRARSQSRKGRPQKAASRALDDVLQDLLPDGPRRFPEDFWSAAARQGAFSEVSLPSEPLRSKGSMFGKEELSTESGEVILARNPQEARYLLFAQANGLNIVRLPEKPVEVSRTVNDYTAYLRSLRSDLEKAFFSRTLQQALAESLARQAWKQLNLPDIED